MPSTRELVEPPIPVNLNAVQSLHPKDRYSLASVNRIDQGEASSQQAYELLDIISDLKEYYEINAQDKLGLHIKTYGDELKYMEFSDFGIDNFFSASGIVKWGILRIRYDVREAMVIPPPQPKQTDNFKLNIVQCLDYGISRRKSRAVATPSEAKLAIYYSQLALDQKPANFKVIPRP